MCWKGDLLPLGYIIRKINLLDTQLKNSESSMMM